MHSVASFLFVLIELRQKNTSLPNDGRRQSRPHSSLPQDVLVGAKVNGRFAFTDSRGIRSSKLGPPHLGAVLRRTREARQNHGWQKSDPKSSSHEEFRVGICPSSVYKL